MIIPSLGYVLPLMIGLMAKFNTPTDNSIFYNDVVGDITGRQFQSDKLFDVSTAVNYYLNSHDLSYNFCVLF